MNHLRSTTVEDELESRQGEIDGLLRDHVEAVRVRMKESDAEKRGPWASLELERLRQAGQSMARRPRDQWETYSEVLRAARDTVRGWHGKLYLVYLPVHYVSRESWLVRLQRGQPEWRRQEILKLGRALAVPVIDLEPVFLEAGPQLATFLYPHRAHFTAAGYEAMGRAIAKRLEADGF